MNVKIYIVLKSEVRTNTQYIKRFNQLFQVRYINKNISVVACRSV